MRLLIILIATFLLLGLAALGLSIGRLISGKNRLKRGCGMNPDDKEKCHLCGDKKSCDKDKQNG